MDERAHGGRSKKRLIASLRRQWEPIDRRLQDWLAAEDEDDEEQDDDEDDDDWRGRLVHPEVSLTLYQLFMAFDGHHLPWPGGLLDQPDWWIHDMNLLAARKARWRRKRKRNKAPRERVQKLKAMLDQRKRERQK